MLSATCSLLPATYSFRFSNFPMLKFIVSTLYTALLLPVFLRWGRQQAEAQIDKMQESVFNTPGAEAPLPPLVLIGGIGLISSHFFLGRRGLGLKGWQILLSLGLGLLIGVSIFLNRFQNFTKS